MGDIVPQDAEDQRIARQVPERRKDDFSTWGTSALCAEMWNECGNAILWGFLGIPLIVIGGVVALVSPPLSVAMITSGVAVLWFGRSRWAAIGRELRNRRTPAERGNGRDGE